MKNYHSALVQIVTILILVAAFSPSGYAQRMMMDKIMENPPAIFMQQMMGDMHPNARMLGPGFFSNHRPYVEVFSPATSQFAGTEAGDLYLRAENSDQLKKFKPQAGWYWHIENASWSPSGKYLVAKQINVQGVPTITLKGRNDEVTTKPYFRAGEKIPKDQFYILNTETGKTVAVKQNPALPYIHAMGWTNKEELYFIQADRLMKEMDLLRADVKTGNLKLILKEQSSTYLIGLDLLQGYSNELLELDIVTFLENKNQFVWLSERSGSKQLYLYDDSGKLIRSITDESKNGVLERVVGVDDQQEWVYFTTHADSKNPYAMQTFRASLSKNTIEKLADKEGIFDVFFSAKKDSLWILRNGLPALLELDVYTADGKYLSTPWKGNTTILEDGYFNFEYPSVVAADGVTMVDALLLKPNQFDPKKVYPVVEYIYGGNFDKVVIRDLFNPSPREMQELANKGFIVVFIDGRGTPQRGKSFQDFSYGKFGQVELQDHIAAIKQLGKDRPYMNMNKIDILGHSWGGHFALRALLEAPDFYKAGHISAPAIDPINFRVAIEPFIGCLPQDCPELYKKLAITTKLTNLVAPLMIVHGTNDDDVPIEESYKLVEKLAAINYKNYQFIVYPGADHIVMRNPEWKPTMMEFFAEKLQN